MEELKAENDVALQEQVMQLEQAVQSGQMIQARYDLEIEKMQKAHEEELVMAEQQMTSELIGQIQQVRNHFTNQTDSSFNGFACSSAFLNHHRS